MSLSPLYNESDLLAEVARGNENAFKVLFDRYWDKIFSVAFVLTKSVVLAEEIVQDVFLKIWLNRLKLPEIENFEGYLFIIGRNHIFNELRNKTENLAFSDDLLQFFQEASLQPEQQFIIKESEQLVMEAADHLPAQQKKIFLLSRKAGLTHEEIAKMLGLSRLTVKTHIHLALKFIRGFIEKHNASI